MIQVGLNNYQIGNSNVAERADNKKAENKTEDKYASVSAYEAYCNAALYSRRKKHFVFNSINIITALSFR